MQLIQILIMTICELWFIFVPIIIMLALRIFVNYKIAKRNARIEYENQKQAYKDALREFEKEKRE